MRVVDGFLRRRRGGARRRHGRVLDVARVGFGRAAGRAVPRSDTFALLNAALAPPRPSCASAPGSTSSRPSSSSTPSGSSASFPRTSVRLGRGASATVVEYFEGGVDALVVPAERVPGRARTPSLHLITYQRLDASAWHVARTTGFLETDARLRQAVIGMGATTTVRATTPRCAAPARENELRTTFLGSGTQVHDFRTRQFHAGQRSALDAAVQGRGRRLVAVGLHRTHRDREGRQAHRRAPDEPQPAAVTGRARRQRAQPGHPRERRRCAPTPRASGRSTNSSAGTSSRVASSREEAERLMIQGFFNEMLATLPARARPNWSSATSPRCWPACGGDAVTTSTWATSSDFVSGVPRQVRVADRVLVVVRIEDDVYVLDDRCSHEEFSLAEGEVDVETLRDRVRAPRRDVPPAATAADVVPGDAAGRALRRARRRRATGGGGAVTSTLDHRGLRVEVAGKEVLKGFDLTMQLGRGPRHHGPERLGQVDAGPRAGRVTRGTGRRRFGHHRRGRAA